jgi:hypothetical protein
MRQTKLSIVKLTKQLDGLMSFSDQKEEAVSIMMVEIIGLEMLEERIPVILDDHRSISDDDISEAESDSFANDSVEIAIKKRENDEIFVSTFNRFDFLILCYQCR